MIGVAGFFIFGRENVRLYASLNPRMAAQAADIELFVFCSLDIVDEKLAKVNEMYLGQLYSDQKYKTYGFVTNSGVRMVLVVTINNCTLKDQEIRLLFKKFHVYYCNTISNPFYSIGKPLQSKWLIEGSKELFASMD